MNRLAHAIRTASNDAYLKVSLETVADDLTNCNVSMEQHLGDIQDMIGLAEGLEMIVVSVESMDSPSHAQQSAARSNALSYLTMSGLSHSEAANIFPSLEADAPATSAWEKFKAFILRLWNFIVESAKKLYEFVRTFFKQSSLAEKAAMAKLRSLRAELKEKRSGLTHDATIKLRPAHRYLLSPTNELNNFNQLKQNVKTFITARDTVQTKLPAIIIKVGKDLEKAIDKIALGGDTAQVSASVEGQFDAMKEAVSPMFPKALSQALGMNGLEIPLIHDRVLRIKRPQNSNDGTPSDEEIRATISQYGIEVGQVTNNYPKADEMGTFPALSISEIDQLLKLVNELIDTGHSADQERQWNSIARTTRELSMIVDSTVKAILKMKDLTPKARNCMSLAANARHAMDRWAGAPYTQLNTVNIRIVDSILSLAEDQIKNYEMTDSMQEKADKEKTEREKEDKRKSAKSDKTGKPTAAADKK